MLPVKPSTLSFILLHCTDMCYQLSHTTVVQQIQRQMSTHSLHTNKRPVPTHTCISYTADPPPPAHVTQQQQQQQYTCYCERETDCTVMCCAASRVEYMSIAARALSSLPVSPRLMTRLSRQQHATADRHCDSMSDTLLDFDDDDDDESSMSI